MEYFDNLVISLLDSDSNKGLFIGEICDVLNVPKTSIGDVWLKSNITNGVINQEICVSFIDTKIKKEDLVKLPFKHIYENIIVFEVGDTIL